MSKDISIPNSLAVKARVLRGRGMARRLVAKKLGVHHAVVRAVENGTAKIKNDEDKDS